MNKFHEAALAQGGSNNGEPGPRPDYGPDYYGAFVYDLDGNKIEATSDRAAAEAGGRRSRSKKKAAAKPPRRQQAKTAKKKEESPAAVSDSVVRCAWSGEDPLYVAYHDEEWGVPEYDPRALYEKLVLDGFQAGLSWITILQEAREFPQSLPRFRSGEDRALRQARFRAPDEERRHHPLQRQDQGGDQGRAALARHRGEGAGRLLAN